MKKVSFFVTDKKIVTALFLFFEYEIYERARDNNFVIIIIVKSNGLTASFFFIVFKMDTLLGVGVKSQLGFDNLRTSASL